MQSIHSLPGVLLYFPLSHTLHFVAPFVLDFPFGQLVHVSSGISFPIVPAKHALKPESSDASILDPFGTTTDADPPVATMCPSGTPLQSACSGAG